MLIGMKDIQYEINNLPELLPHILLSGARGCFVGGTKILMKDFSWKVIEEVKEGDEILGFSEKGDKYLKPTKVITTMSRTTDELVYLKSTHNEVWTTLKHPFLTLRVDCSGKQNSRWNMAKSLTAQHRLYNFSVNDRNTDWKRGWILGILCSDGTISKNPYNIHLYNKNKVILDAYNLYLEELFNIKPSPILKENGVTQLSFNNKVIHYLLHKWEDNILSGNIKAFNKDFLRGFIGGFFDGDGSAGRNHSIDFANTNLGYLKTIEIVVKGLGFHTYWNPKKFKVGKIRGYTRKKKMYLLQVYDFIQFYTIFQPLTKHIYTKLSKTKSQQIWVKKIFQTTSRQPCRGFKKERITKTVYNLETETGTYVANGFPVHNCGKTASAEALAIKRKKNLIILTAHTLTIKEVHTLLMNLKGGEIILIDEIHKLQPKVEEALYLPMERYFLTLQTKSGQNIKIKLPHFTLIGTTTKSSDISKPLISRFQLHFIIPHYSLRNLSRIVKYKFPSLTLKECLKISKKIVTPREALNLAYRVTQLPFDVDKAFEFIGYKNDLSLFERKYLKLLEQRVRLSLTSLTFTLQLDKSEVRKIEDKLINLDYLEVKSNGRFLTVKGKKLLEVL